MGLCLSKTTTAASPCWPDLPPEIAGEILSRLLTHDDRLNFKTVCREWHLAASQQGQPLPPAVPCINLGHGIYQSVVTNDNGTNVYRHRFATPKGSYERATFSGWVMYRHKRSRRCYLYKPFSPSTPDIKVSCRYETFSDVTGTDDNPLVVLLLLRWLSSLKKIIVSSSRIVVALTGNALLIDAPGESYYFSPKTVNMLWTSDFCYKDIAFRRGKIFVVSSTDHLFSHWLVGKGEGLSESLPDPTEGLFSHWSSGEAPSQIRTEYVIKKPPSAAAAANTKNYHYLVTSADNQKLLMVRWGISQRSNDVEVANQTMSLQVFEADFDMGRWLEVKDLGSQVLFVGRKGSKAFLVEGSSEHYYGQKFRGGNRVVLLGHDWELARRLDSADPIRCFDRQKLANTIPSYCIYDMATGESSLISLNGGYGSTESTKIEWFFPSE